MIASSRVYEFHSRHTDVFSLDGVPGSAETETDILVPSPASLPWLAGLRRAALVVEEHVRLLLESALALDGKLGRHGCCGGLSRRGGWVVNEVVGVEKRSSASA